MVAFFDDKEHAEQSINSSPSELLDALISNTVMKQKVDTFKSLADQERINTHSLFICQGEYGVINFSRADQINWIGTAGATTCHIVVVHDMETVALAHIDSPKAVNRTIENMISSLGNELSLFVVGGFSDEDDKSYPISSALLKYFCLSEKRFNIQLWNTLALNTRFIDDRPHPLITDIAFRLEDKSIHNVVFDYRGPELELRSCLRWNSEQDVSIFDMETGFITIPYFEFERDPRYQGAAAAPDEFLLSHCSTSPHCEPEYFCQDMRNLFRFIASMDSTLIFGPNKLPVIYQIDCDGKWVKKNSDT
jgi:hypothetical protein